MQGEFASFFNKIVDEIITYCENKSEVTTVEMRFYGGWTIQNSLTDRASQLLINIGIVNEKVYPVLDRFVSVNCELATNLINYRDLVISNTLRQRNGTRRLRINREMLSETCELNRSCCPIHILNKFTRKKNKICSVEDCTCQQNQAFLQNEQKQVDTHIACDILDSIEDNDVKGILMISGDVDILPPMLLASARSPGSDLNYILPKRIEKNNDKLLAYIKSFGINTYEL